MSVPDKMMARALACSVETHPHALRAIGTKNTGLFALVVLGSMALLQSGLTPYTWRLVYGCLHRRFAERGLTIQMNQQLIDGFEVQWLVLHGDDGNYHVHFTTRAPSESDAKTWRVPGARAFDSQEAAERYGKYVLLGLKGVDAKGEPVYTVI